VELDEVDERQQLTLEGAKQIWGQLGAGEDSDVFTQHMKHFFTLNLGSCTHGIASWDVATAISFVKHVAAEGGELDSSILLASRKDTTHQHRKNALGT